jgi:hypothetical protein
MAGKAVRRPQESLTGLSAWFEPGLQHGWESEDGVVKMNGRCWNLGCYFCSDSSHRRPRVGGELTGRYVPPTTAFVPTDPVSVERMIEG